MSAVDESSADDNRLLKLIQKANEQQTCIIKKDFEDKFSQILKITGESCDKISKLEENNAQLDRKLRRNNIIVFGLEIDEKDIICSTIDKLNNVLETNITINDINNIRKVGKKDQSSPSVLIEFVSFLKKREVYGRVSKLKGSGVSIANDMSFDDRQKQKILLTYMKKARDQGLSATLNGTNLTINNKTYTVQNLKDLEDITGKEGSSSSSSQEDLHESAETSEGGTCSKGKVPPINETEGMDKKKRMRKKVYSPKNYTSRSKTANKK